MTPPPTTEERERLRALTHETLRPEQVWELAAAVPGLLSSLASAEERARRAEGERDEERRCRLANEAEMRRADAGIGALRAERDALAKLSALQDSLLVCYRTGRNPGAVLDKLAKARERVAALAVPPSSPRTAGDDHAE
jgi:hypothetical protein